MRAFLYHVHGLGSIDFSDLNPVDLPQVQQEAAERDYTVLPTVYMRRENLARVVEVVREYGRLAAAGAVPNIAGFAIEGPLLGPQGGIPRAGRWYPTGEEWSTIASLGPLGLRYIVMAPDAMDLTDTLDEGMVFADLLIRFYDNGLRVALGHFHRNDPERSAGRLRNVLQFLHSRYPSSPYLVLTDHLYNDMPRNFTHCWRTPQERAARSAELDRVLTPDWNKVNLAELLGPVPAAMLQAARDDLLFPCLNFDGYHVDLDYCQRTLEFLGADRVIAITDHTEVDTMALEPLHRSAHHPLWLRDDGAVAAGSSGFGQQREHILGLGNDESVVTRLFVTNPRAAISYRVPLAVA
jgi:hypothetical protein